MLQRVQKERYNVYTVRTTELCWLAEARKILLPPVRVAIVTFTLVLLLALVATAVIGFTLVILLHSPYCNRCYYHDLYFGNTSLLLLS